MLSNTIMGFNFRRLNTHPNSQSTKSVILLASRGGDASTSAVAVAQQQQTRWQKQWANMHDKVRQGIHSLAQKDPDNILGTGTMADLETKERCH